MRQDKTNERGAKTPRCAICGGESAHAFRPFCSRRCADVDLARWLTGTYAIPVLADEDEDGENTGADMLAVRTGQDGPTSDDN